MTGAPSGKTSYVVVGANAGPSKLAALAKLQIATLDEDGLLQLVATREGVLDDKTKKKLKEEEKKLDEGVRELERAEKAAVRKSKQAGAKKCAPVRDVALC